jgi:hypothetical protein
LNYEIKNDKIIFSAPTEPYSFASSILFIHSSNGYKEEIDFYNSSVSIDVTPFVGDEINAYFKRYGTDLEDLNTVKDGVSLEIG